MKGGEVEVLAGQVEPGRYLLCLLCLLVRFPARFHIHGVTGPDEYTAVVNNNMFTNVMARANLKLAADLVQELEEADPLCWDRLVQTLDVAPEEVEEWRACAKGMVISLLNLHDIVIHIRLSHFRSHGFKSFLSVNGIIFRLLNFFGVL